MIWDAASEKEFPHTWKPICQVWFIERPSSQSKSFGQPTRPGKSKQLTEVSYNYTCAFHNRASGTRLLAICGLFPSSICIYLLQKSAGQFSLRSDDFYTLSVPNVRRWMEKGLLFIHRRLEYAAKCFENKLFDFSAYFKSILNYLESKYFTLTFWIHGLYYVWSLGVLFIVVLTVFCLFYNNCFILYCCLYLGQESLAK